MTLAGDISGEFSLFSCLDRLQESTLTQIGQDLRSLAEFVSRSTLQGGLLSLHGMISLWVDEIRRAHQTVASSTLATVQSESISLLE